ncbi:transposase [Bremerella sp. JC817]|uniref:transposase n=1 Tax=Bremerella sp. JC817 TaxID=3231756 RepID=UPI00345922B5
MSTKQNNLIAVARLSMKLAGKFMRPYSHEQAPKRYTQPQLMTCLVLKAYLKTTYRGVIEIIDASDKLRDAIGFAGRLPNYSTLKYFSDRSQVAEIADAMLVEIVKKFAPAEKEVAIDSTGLETTSASVHFRARSGSKRKKFLKLSVCVLVGSLLPAGMVLSWGPGNDKCEAMELMGKSAQAIMPKKLFADAGYDADWVHVFSREVWKAESWIPPVTHRRDGTLGGEYRPLMTEENLKNSGYTKRWKVESFMSGLKRTVGSTLSARKPSAMLTEAALKVLTYALRR